LREGGPAGAWPVDLGGLVPCHVEGAGHRARGRDLALVTLAVAERERVDVKPRPLGEGQSRGRVDPAAQQGDGFRFGRRGRHYYRKLSAQAQRYSDEMRSRPMTSQQPTLPRTGPIPRPSSPTEAREYLKTGAF